MLPLSARSGLATPLAGASLSKIAHIGEPGVDGDLLSCGLAIVLLVAAVTTSASLGAF